MTDADHHRVASAAQRKARTEARVDQIIANLMHGMPADGAGRGRPQKRRHCEWCGDDMVAGRYVPWCSPECRTELKRDAALRALRGEI